MVKFILVPATGTATDQPVFAAALTIARRSAAHIEFLHVRMDVREVVAAMASADISGGTGFEQTIDTMEQDAAARQERAEQEVHAFCQREGLRLAAAPDGDGVSAELRVEVGDEADWLAEHGRTADLLVIGRPREDEPVAMDLLEAALLDTGRPVLIAPAATPPSIGRSIAIAWKDTPETARAVGAAQPFVTTAERVTILAVDEGVRTAAETCERLAGALRWSNPAVTVRRLQPESRPPVDTLLAAAKAGGCDLLVMGGYSRSRVREVVFGGFTRHVLKGADLPVLMTH
jgi:nucleotide-binding universal stress UspA family protein